MNTLTVLPEFDISNHTHILPSLERAQISTADLLTLDALDVAKRAHVPPGEVKKLADALIDALHADTVSSSASSRDNGEQNSSQSENSRNLSSIRQRAMISTLDDDLDTVLGGGIARGHLTEIVGESAAGKTQFLLTLLLAVQISNARTDTKGDHGTAALYISTEAPLQTTRLAQILKTHPKLVELPPIARPSLSKVHSTHIHDLEAQEHILRYQVPVAIEKHNVGLLVIDSVAANYRAEFDKGGPGRKGSEALAKRSAQLAKTGSFLRSLAHKHNIAVVVANQVADRFTSIEPGLAVPSQSTQSTRPGTPLQRIAPTQDRAHLTSVGLLSNDDPLALDHQQRFFTGWGDDPSMNSLKTPSLGLTWTNQLSARIALLKDPIYENKAYAPGDERNLIGWNRALKIVFGAWCGESNTKFEIWEGGIRMPSTGDGE
ncbi:DNA repair protein rhp57 [Pseudocercospora fuligena]|uniref:DNA repair protein rhp57 n=1 Tax=Pseudocercospora fuligena TaxID=685502 RepID=A0A8H6VIK8_9PEZI|nr:DNA repair protein rhp57 [Pseudocercospora fuligena]